jgi:hypothetical protein
MIIKTKAAQAKGKNVKERKMSIDFGNKKVSKGARYTPYGGETKIQKQSATSLHWSMAQKEDRAIHTGFGRVIEASVLYPLASIKKVCKGADGRDFFVVKLASEAALDAKNGYWLVRCRGDGNDRLHRMIALPFVPADSSMPIAPCEEGLRWVALKPVDAMPSREKMTGAVAFFLRNQHEPVVEKQLMQALDNKAFPASWTCPLDIVTFQKLAPLLSVQN